MEKKQLKRLSLKKEVVSSLTTDELKNLKGGWTTTFGHCSYFPCCEDWTIVESCNYTNCDVNTCAVCVTIGQDSCTCSTPQTQCLC